MKQRPMGRRGEKKRREERRAFKQKSYMKTKRQCESGSLDQG